MIDRTRALVRGCGILLLAVSTASLFQACASTMPRRPGYDRSCGCWSGGSSGAKSGSKPAPTVESTETGTTLSGIASYYGDEFDGKPTASGQIFSNSARTCAHRTWAFGTRVKVTSVKTGRSTVVTVNDRGPHVQGRILDLSKAAAADIGLDIEGVGEVRAEVIP